MILIKKDHYEYRNIFIISMISVLMGQIYTSPTPNEFRMTFAVFFMSLFLIYFENYSIMLIVMSVGISTFLFRVAVNYVGSEVPLMITINIYLPVLAYYFFYGVLFKFLKVRNYYDHIFNFFLSLWICDVIPNIIEISIRKIWMYSSFNTVVVKVITIGAVRTILTIFVYYLSRYYMNILKKNEREKYFGELIVFISKFKTELYLLNKSRDDIERAVSYAHNIYDSTVDVKDKTAIIRIIKDIHEIKKDYLRVISGMNLAFNFDSQTKYLSIKDILNIVRDNLNNLALQQKKKIYVTISYDKIFITSDFYTIISILNNLTVNSLEAIVAYGKIEIKASLQDDCVKIEVIDTGEGIIKDKYELIFNIGYTTKYDVFTGKMATGVGLSHVKQLIDEHYGGTIDIESEPNVMTKFTILIPKNKIILKENI